MKTVAILGDSWGEPNWRGPHRPGFTEQGHLATRLRNRGMTVINYSQSGGSNMVTWLNLAAKPIPVDVIIWFHTDVSRDWPWQEIHDQPWRCQDLLDQTADRVYARSRSIMLSLAHQPQLILVEGQSPVHQPIFDQYFRPDYWVRDWRSQLVGRQLPLSQLVGPLSSADSDFFLSCLDSLEEQHRLIDNVEVIMQAMRASELFPDNCHPGDLAHGLLADELESVIMQAPSN